MASLHMETEVAHTTQSTLVSENEEIASVLGEMSSAISNLQNNWTGSSASQFFQEYTQWRDVMGRMLKDLLTMSTRLKEEIIQWEQAAERFN